MRRATGIGSGLLAVLAHTRPRSWPIVAAHLATGTLITTGLPGSGETGALLVRTVIAATLWAGALNGGTLALNSAIDRDAGPVGYLDHPPPPPRYLAAAGLLLMVLGGIAGGIFRIVGLLGPAWVPLYGLCVVLSLLYSVPPVRLKARPGADLVVNMIGYGALTLLAGWAATGMPLPRSVAIASLAGAALFAALYPLTQIYQMDDDARAGVRTLALALGSRGSLLLALVSVLAAFALLVAAGQGRAHQLRTLFLVPPLAAWLVVLLPRLRRGAARPGPEAMYSALRAWALTDLAMVLALAPA